LLEALLFVSEDEDFESEPDVESEEEVEESEPDELSFLALSELELAVSRARLRVP
jgi:hypothetical protein